MARKKKTQYWTGRGYGIFLDGKLVETAVSLSSALMEVRNRTIIYKAEKDAEYVIDYIPLKQVKETAFAGLALSVYTGQIDESLCALENLPMKANRAIAETRDKYILYKYE